MNYDQRMSFIVICTSFWRQNDEKMIESWLKSEFYNSFFVILMKNDEKMIELWWEKGVL